METMTLFDQGDYLKMEELIYNTAKFPFQNHLKLLNFRICLVSEEEYKK